MSASHRLRTSIERIAHSLPGNSNLQFWLLQAFGWSAFCLVTYLSLTLWYSPLEWVFASHTILQAMLGFFLSIPLRSVAKWAWKKNIVVRALSAVLSLFVVSLAWTALRIITFEWLTGIDIVFRDYGGWFLLSLSAYTGWLVSYYCIKYYKLFIEEKNLALSAQNLAQQEHVKRLLAEGSSREAQLKMLRYQLNPHFLFNAINSINALIKTERNKEARMMLSKLSDFLRVSLDTDPKLLITLEREIEILDLYLQIEKVRFGDRLQLEFDIDPSCHKTLVPSLLLQPLYENAMKFAISKSVKGGKISFRTHLHDGQLHLTLADDGPGLPTDGQLNNETVRGVGLRNTRERLVSLYGDNYSFDLSSNTPHGLVISISIPAAKPTILAGEAELSAREMRYYGANVIKEANPRAS